MPALKSSSIVCAALLLLSCSSGQDGQGSHLNAPQVEGTVVPLSTGYIDTAEVFVDSLSIGRKGQDRLEMGQYRTEDSVYVVLRLFAIEGGASTLRQEIVFAKDGISGLHAELADFNNDGFNDLTCVSATAARGANEIRRLWIYDAQGDSLVYIKNSMDYPNLLYNERLDCIDAFRVYGGCSTDYLRIEGDSLREFATVELSEGLTVTTIDRLGRERVIHRDTAEQAEYVRYKNFAPLEVYEDY